MDIKRMRILAGVPAGNQVITESYDDDEDPDVKVAMKDKRQQEFEKKHGKDISAAEKEAKEKAAKAKADKEAKKTDAPKKEPAEKPANNSGKTKGRKTSERGGSMRQWLIDNPSSSRGQFITKATEHGMSKAHANTLFYSIKKKLSEAWMIFHPTVGNFVLAENEYLGRFQWVSLNDVEGFDPLIFESESAAKKVFNTFDSFGYNPGVIKQVILDDDVM